MPFGTLHKIFTLQNKLNPAKQMISLIQRSVHMTGANFTDEMYQKPDEELQVKSEMPPKFQTTMNVNQVTLMGKLTKPPRPLLNPEGNAYGYAFRCVSKHYNKNSEIGQNINHDVFCLRRNMFDLIRQLKGNETMLFMGRLTPRHKPRPEDRYPPFNILVSNFFFKVDDSHLNNDDNVLE